MITRRNLISGLTAFIAAPAIIRVAGIMPIRAFTDDLIFESEVFRGFAKYEYKPALRTISVKVDGFPVREIRAGDLQPGKLIHLRYDNGSWVVFDRTAKPLANATL